MSIISYLNSLLQPFSFIPSPPIPAVVSTGSIYIHVYTAFAPYSLSHQTLRQDLFCLPVK
jgi:hypothetical protein